MCGKRHYKKHGIEKSQISFIWGFLSSTHLHVPDKRRAKIDNKNEKFICISYNNNSKGYKLYNPNNGKIVINWDFFFFEERECNFSSNVYDFKFFPIKEDDHMQIKQVEEQ